MYSRKFPQSLLQTKPNLRNVILEANINSKSFFQYSFYIQKFTSADAFKTLQSVQTKFKTFVKNDRLLNFFKNSVVGIPKNLKDQSSKTLRVWAHQCECVFAQRLRRSQQMFSLYSKIWEERALKEFINNIRQQVARQSKQFIIGSACVGAAWDNFRITDEQMKEHVNELEYINKLRSATVRCKNCEAGGENFCTCAGTGKASDNLSYDNWTLFISKDDLLVWRRPHPAGYFEYKVYGHYDDVSAEDFLNVQVDIEYRKFWDATAIRLELIEHDPESSKHGDLIYWEMLWPRLFSNRDYVFQRRFMVDSSSKSVILMNQSIDHPHYPTKSDKYRIKDYWSYMVIKPLSSDFKKSGIEFGLTYYDNPGVNIPTPVMTWVAMRAMPDFLANLRAASKKYKAYCHESGHHCACNIFSEDECVKEHKVSEGECGPHETAPRLGSAPGSELMTSPSPMTQHETTRTGFL